MNTKLVSATGAGARRFYCVLLLLAALASRLPAADTPADFLLMKLYEASLRAVNLRSDSPTPSPGSGHLTNTLTWTPPDYGCALWLGIAPSTNNLSNVVVTLHNTIPGTNYQILSKTNLGDANWTTETNVTGAGGQDWTSVTIPKLGRAELFFITTETRNYAVETNFAGLDLNDTLFTVADTMGAIGPNHFVELLNGKIAVFSRTNGAKLEEATMLDFFQPGAVLNTNCPTSPFMGDPRILYDHESQRWVATAIQFCSAKIVLAVTRSSNPALTNWMLFPVDVAAAGQATDYDTLGLDANGIYITALHRYTTNGNTFNSGHSIAAINKQELYQSNLVITNFQIDAATNDLKVWTVQPAVNFDSISTNAYAWLVAKGPPQLGSNYQGGSIFYRRLQWSNTTAILVDTNWQTLLQPTNVLYQDYYDVEGTNLVTLPSEDSGIQAPQAGGSTKISLIDVGSRLMNAVIRGGFLYTCHHIGLSGTNGTYSGNETGTNVDRSGAQWFKLRLEPSGVLSYYKHGRIYDAAPTNMLWYYFPSIAVNCAADMMLGFSGSSATNYISAYYAWRPAAPPNR